MHALHVLTSLYIVLAWFLLWTCKEERWTYPVHSTATHPTPLQTEHWAGLAEQPDTASLAQSALVF